MLQLTKRNDWQFENTLSSEYKEYDRNWYTTPRFNRPIHAKRIGCALAPLAYNALGIAHASFSTENASMDSINEQLESLYEAYSQTKLGLIRIYTQDVDAVADFLESDLYINPPEGVQDLYNKAMQQCAARQELNEDSINIKVKLMRGKHIIVTILNYDDDDQASDMFLTIGLIPVLFPDWKEKFSEEEMNYFKVLVNRSQVKRIANIKAQNAFDIMVQSKKYLDAIKELRMVATIDTIINNKVQKARTDVRNADDNMARYLRAYGEACDMYNEAVEVLEQVDSTQGTMKEELLAAIKVEGIVNVAQQGSYLIEDIVVPCQFYNADEAELVVNNMSDNWVKQFFQDVFVDNKYTLMLFNKFYFNINGKGADFREPNQVDLDCLKANDCMFNPHTYFFHCLGDYRPQLVKAQSKIDLLMFNNLAVASAKSINFRDGTVINRWKDALMSWSRDYPGYNTDVLDIKCLVDKDGLKHSLAEVYLNSNTNDEEAELAEAEELEVHDL